ncbi:hypothetical protein [Marinilabilia salmonicolor]|jgi:hypothetical protein|uniref:Uncharacterized protein n=1 Tax=Marinilabilia salmonicolor TaxID=989 RepID=A0A368UTW8_9BACT|nr:hypothetical protein [Marinilabilia salmonicolor]RCW30834.1 hypothetical protein DFO77_12052 [Marinilabilia salmonicolor]
MKIGNNIHTTSNKKAYRKPVLEVVEMDREIVIMNVSDTSEPWETSSLQTEGQTTLKEKNTVFPESDDPFGGNTPDYNYQR